MRHASRVYTFPAVCETTMRPPILPALQPEVGAKLDMCFSYSGGLCKCVWLGVGAEGSVGEVGEFAFEESNGFSFG
jgi:hypothetical protein